MARGTAMSEPCPRPINTAPDKSAEWCQRNGHCGCIDIQELRKEYGEVVYPPMTQEKPMYEDIEVRLLLEADDTRSEEREKLLRDAADVIHRLRKDLMARIQKEREED